jgi:hypothetical protein
MTRVLTDYHHDDLFYSLQLLFEKRLGWELYRPMGLEWYEQGYWNIFPHIDTARQFLGIDQASNRPRDIRGNPLSDRECLNARYVEDDGIYYIANPTKDNIQRGISLEKFKNTEFDVLLSSIPQHVAPYNELITKFQPKAKHIFQVGNAWGHVLGVKNLLASTAPFSVPSDIRACFYHQEFDTSMFCYEAPTAYDRVNSYIHWMRAPECMKQVASYLPSWNFKSYGAGMEETISLTSNIAKTMKASAFTWHHKPEGDGYGHIIHNSYACGRPAIVWRQHYKNKLASDLFVPGNCIFADGLSAEDLAKAIHRYAHPNNHIQMCEKAVKRFQEVVNFDYEFDNVIKPFMENLI